MSFDPRVTPIRDGIASRRLEGVIAAEVYLDPRPMSCVAPAAGIRRHPDAESEQMDQLLFGEVFEVIEEEGAYLWGQARRDGYVGFVEAAALAPLRPAPTHRVSAIRTYAFAEPSIKSRAIGPYSINALVSVEAEEGRLAKVAGSGWVTAAHLAPIGAVEADHAAVAERFLGAPYLWGGRESLGLDCSGLVQQALFACGRACPRDTDQQAAMGAPIERGAFARGDLVFWKGHVAIGLDAARIIHANGHHMAVAIEPLDAAISRIAAAGVGQPTGYRRV
ncbi:peptidoglycan endopeptidase [Phenylobacterium hankyongense]|uniref:Peptidoglycan endopeptidase n=1 Tax=Phenylobacterium hankyongense TaxID=1813876 RepID=A0A328AY91_9CAUL|nr:NlpC/P60 family protein [Phenylobacterium hankyongense]RAK59893.1 peptidoglycan endopeptidase [Phenylobacterium hankyongense]